MKFNNVEILSWHKRLPHEDMTDIASSGVPTISDLNELGIDTSNLPLWGDNVISGSVKLKELLSERYNVHPDRIIITPGASMANFMLMTALLQPGDSVMVESPTYRPLAETAEAITEMETISFQRRQSENYHLNIDDDSIDQHHPKLLSLTNPNNPTGIYDPLVKISLLADKMEPHGGTVHVDEIFLPFMEDGDRMSVAAIDSRVISTCSMTKAWGLSGLRVGWMIAPAEVVRLVERNQNYMHVLQPYITEHIAYQVLSDRKINDRILEFARTRSQENRLIVKQFMDQHPELIYTEPDVGVIALVRFQDGRSIDDFYNKLLDKHHTVITPGLFFDVKDGFRIGFGMDKDTLTHGLEAISSVLHDER